MHNAQPIIGISPDLRPALSQPRAVSVRGLDRDRAFARARQPRVDIHRAIVGRQAAADVAASSPAAAFPLGVPVRTADLVFGARLDIPRSGHLRNQRVHRLLLARSMAVCGWGTHASTHFSSSDVWQK